MTNAVTELLEASKALSVADRLDLLAGIRETLGPVEEVSEFGLSSEQEVELQRRIADWREHPETSLTLPQVRSLFAIGAAET